MVKSRELWNRSVPLVKDIGHQMVSFGERLKEERNRLGMNQAEFGEVAGVTKKTQGLYEGGDRSPNADYLAAIAAAGVDVLYVLTGERTPRKEEGLSVKEQVVLYNFRALSEGDQAAIQRLSHALKESPADYNGGESGNGGEAAG